MPEDAEGVGDIVMHSAQEAELLAENERNPFSVPQVRAQEEVVIIEAEDEAPSSDGGDSKHWVTHFLQAVPLQRNLLSDRAQTANANKSMAACMWQCTVPDILFTGSGKHCEYLTLEPAWPRPDRRPFQGLSDQRPRKGLTLKGL